MSESEIFDNGLESSNEALDFRLFLKAELMRRMGKNANYSLRAFAKFLGVDHSTLSQILRGKRKVSRSACQAMCQTLGLDPATQQIYIDSVDQENHSEDLMKFHQMKMDVFITISDWTHDAILELTRLQHFQPETSFIARALGIEHSEADAAVQRLVRVGLLKIENGVWQDLSGNNSVLFDSAFTTPVLQSYQQRLLKKSIDCVEDVPKPLRDHTSIVLAMDSSLLDEVKEQIKVFRRSLASFIEKKSRKSADQVYSMQISLFPLTASAPKEKDSK